MQSKTPELSANLKLLAVIIPIIFLTIAVILNTSYRGDLFTLGINQIYRMQSNQSPTINFIQNVFSLFGNPIAVSAVLGLQYIFSRRKILVFVNLIYIMGGLYFMALLKQIYQQSRPYWYSGQIKILEWTCPTDFGNPSGHSFIVIALYQPLLSDFIGVGRKKYLFIIWIIIVPLVMISRMYLGAHSLDQIIFGAMMGLTFLVMYRYKVQQFLYEIIFNLLNQRFKLLYFIGNTIVFVFFLIVPIIVFQLNTDNRPIDATQIQRINSDCGKQVTEDSLKQSMLKATVGGFFSLGLIYGYILVKNNQKSDVYYNVGHWTFKNIRSIFYFWAAIIFIVAFPTTIFVVILPMIIKQAIINFIFMAFGLIWAGISLVFVVPAIQNKYEWVTYDNTSITE